MPVCADCSDTFPNRVEIGGRLHNVSNRKYCIECSPFGLHNTRPVNRIRRGDVVVCYRCSRRYEYDKSKGHTQRLCNSCNANRKRTTVKLRAIAYKGGRCQKCGYNKCKRALSFHHVKGSEKRFGIGGKLSRTWTELQKELDKCILLCANCHMESHCKGCSLTPVSNRET
jgi:hypothetical protein